MREASGGKCGVITNILAGRGYGCWCFRAVGSTSQHRSESSPVSGRKKSDMYENPKSRLQGNEEKMKELWVETTLKVTHFNASSILKRMV